jgi:DNA-binding transcriptional LysR family regulator
VSEIIADLENALGVRLLDRHPHGIEPTKYGDALIRRSTAVFDELQQSVRDIEFLADPTAGKVKFGCTEPMAAILSPIMERFTRQYSRVLHEVSGTAHFDPKATSTRGHRRLLTANQVYPIASERLIPERKG